MKILIPLRTDRFRLVNDLDRPQRQVDKIPAGSVFKIDAFKFNRNTKPESLVFCVVVASPDPSLGMRKYGGTCDYGFTFTMTVAEMRELEVELVEGMS